MSELSGGNVLEEVALGGDDVGPTLGVFLSEDTTNSTSWRFDVYAQVAEGRFFVGTVNTTPAQTHAAAGRSTSRLVAAAYVPGARGWYLIARAPDFQHADIFLSHDKCAAPSFGLTKVEA